MRESRSSWTKSLRRKQVPLSLRYSHGTQPCFRCIFRQEDFFWSHSRWTDQLVPNDCGAWHFSLKLCQRKEDPDIKASPLRMFQPLILPPPKKKKKKKKKKGRPRSKSIPLKIFFSTQNSSVILNIGRNVPLITVMPMIASGQDVGYWDSKPVPPFRYIITWICLLKNPEILNLQCKVFCPGRAASI